MEAWICELPTILTVLICAVMAIMAIAVLVAFIWGLMWLLDWLPEWIVFGITGIMILAVLSFLTWVIHQLICA